MGERGHGSVLALALLFGGVLLIGLAADVARLVAAWQEASHVAHTGAEVGAGWVRPDALYDGDLRVDRPRARAAARDFVRDHGHGAIVRIQGRRVCVTARSTVQPGITRLVGASPRRIAVTACAEPRQG